MQCYKNEFVTGFTMSALKRIFRRNSLQPTPIQTVRIVVFGTGSVGKTSLIKRFLFGSFRRAHEVTIEDEYRQIITQNNHIVDITVLDTSGTYQFPAMRRLAIEKANGFILVYSVDSLQSLHATRRFHKEIIRYKESKTPPIILVGNKSDLPNTYTIDKRVSQKHIEDILMDWNYEIPHIETSAKNNDNVVCVFDTLIKFIDLTKTNIRGEKTSLNGHLRKSMSLSYANLPVQRKNAVYKSYSLDTELDRIDEVSRGMKKMKMGKRNVLKRLFTLR